MILLLDDFWLMLLVLPNLTPRNLGNGQSDTCTNYLHASRCHKILAAFSHISFVHLLLVLNISWSHDKQISWEFFSWHSDPRRFNFMPGNLHETSPQDQNWSKVLTSDCYIDVDLQGTVCVWLAVVSPW